MKRNPKLELDVSVIQTELISWGAITVSLIMEVVVRLTLLEGVNPVTKKTDPINIIQVGIIVSNLSYLRMI